jgi:hypothetical protein
MNTGQTDTKGTQNKGKGQQGKIKGDDMRAAPTHRKGGQAGMKDKDDTKRVDNAGTPTDKRKEIKPNEMGK